MSPKCSLSFEIPSYPVEWFRWSSEHPWASNSAAYASATGFFFFSRRTDPTYLQASLPNLDSTASRAGPGPERPLPLTTVRPFPSMTRNDSWYPSA